MNTLEQNIRRIGLLILVGLIFPMMLFADYPNDKPIKIIVHTKPGGAVDLMARQIAQIAGSYTPQSVVVINKAGGSGLLALANVISAPADGYTLLAFPAAFLAPIQTTDIGFGLDDFHYIACMTTSPEAIFTNKHSQTRLLTDVLDQAKQFPGQQKWCGPGSGTLDHLMAVKVWDKAAISGKWIPYGGGGPAIAAVMGGHADVYVGNPEDILGRENNLQIAAIASKERHPFFPDVPTFKEMGLPLENEVMWRGFAVRKGTDSSTVNYLEKLLWQVSQDTLWHNYIKRTRVQGVFLRNAAFTELVKKDAASSRAYLQKAGFKIGSVPAEAPRPVLFLLGLICLVSAIIIWQHPKPNNISGTVLISMSGLVLAIFFFYQSLYFPAPLKGSIAGAASVPHVWILFLALMSIIVVFPEMRGVKEKITNGNVRVVWIILALLTLYTFLMPVIGFFPATFLMLVGGMLIMRHKSKWIITLAASVVVALMYFVFYQLLMVPLPMGYFF